MASSELVSLSRSRREEVCKQSKALKGKQTLVGYCSLFRSRNWNWTTSESFNSSSDWLIANETKRTANEFGNLHDFNDHSSRARLHSQKCRSFMFSNVGEIFPRAFAAFETRFLHNFPKRRRRIREEKSISSLNYYDFNKARLSRSACLLFITTAVFLFFPLSVI